MRTLALWRGGVLLSQISLREGLGERLDEVAARNPFHGGPRYFYWPFPLSGENPVLHFVAVHTPRFYNWILVWHYIAPHPGDRHLTRRLESGACPVLEAHQRSSFDNTVQAPARKKFDGTDQ